MWGFFCTDTEAVPLGSVTAWLIIWLDEKKKTQCTFKELPKQLRFLLCWPWRVPATRGCFLSYYQQSLKEETYTAHTCFGMTKARIKVFLAIVICRNVLFLILKQCKSCIITRQKSGALYNKEKCMPIRSVCVLRCLSFQRCAAKNRQGTNFWFL